MLDLTDLQGVTIEPFRGDLEALERMAHHAWRDEYGLASFPNLYRPEFVSYLMRLAPDSRHFIAAYRNGEILAFLANIPRTFAYRGQNFRAILSCLLVSRKEYARRGLAQAIINEAVRINQEITSYDFALLYLESGHRSSQLIEKFKREGAPLQFLKRMHVLGRVLDLERVAYSEGLKNWEKMAIKMWGANRLPSGRLPDGLSLEELRPADLPEAVGLLNSYSQRADLARVWSGPEELNKEISCPNVSTTLAVRKQGRLVGLINYLEHDHLGKSVERWAWMNHLHLDLLTTEEKKGIISSFLNHLAGRGMVGVIEWNKQYYSQGFLYRNRFFPYFRSVNLYAWVFRSGLQLGKMKKIYEVQI
ncbi:MAG: hypothetical protein N3G18_07755 [Candidatus Saccharicenans sp.]|nr:hypothetical protein [Candidatus Saccharicenans sp.]